MTTYQTHTPDPLASSHPIRETALHRALAFAGCVIMAGASFWIR